MKAPRPALPKSKDRWITTFGGSPHTPTDAVAYVADVLFAAETRSLTPLTAMVRALADHVVGTLPWRSITLVVTRRPSNLGVTLLPHTAASHYRFPQQVCGAFVRSRRESNSGGVIWYWDSGRFQGRPVLSATVVDDRRRIAESDHPEEPPLPGIPHRTR